MAEMLEWFHANDRPEMTTAMVRTDIDGVRKGWKKAGLIETVAILHQELDANTNLLRHAWREYRACSANLDRAQYIPWTDEEQENIVEDEEDDEEETAGHRQRARISVAVRRQAFNEVTYWWNQIVNLRAQRSKLLGLTNAGINISIDNRNQTALIGSGEKPPMKLYVGFSPDEDWPALPAEAASGAKEEYVEGEYSEAAA